ncbi:MAG TPA: glutathione peroxidase [Acidobacteriota bacterium]|nr:glutathione peroxidase [Acidobacteriota bacterium]
MSRKILFTLVLALFVSGVSGCWLGGTQQPMVSEASSVDCPGALNYTVKSIEGKDVSLCSYKGKVVLIVNTASQCGFTPQYKGLEELYQKYRDRGLRILAFPSNDYGQQEPGTNTEIKQFCEMNYHTTFDLFGKVTVKGDGKAPLFAYLTSGGGNSKLAGEIQWNFSKFLIGPDGKLVARFGSSVTPTSTELTSAIEGLLKAK